METRAEHNDELVIRQLSERVQPRTERVMGVSMWRAIDKSHRRLTAMFGLSAKTYSCGGEGARFGGGVDDFFLKYLAMPTGSSIAMAASSSVGGADDSDEISESESDMLCGLWWRDGGRRKCARRSVTSGSSARRLFNG